MTNWTMGSRVMYYSLPYGHEVFVMDDRKDQFDIWQKNSPRGYDLLFLNTEFEQIDVAAAMKCEQVDEAGRLDVTLNGSKVNRAAFVWCRNYQGVNP